MPLQGPNLGGLFGRQSGTMDGFSYSKANKEKAVHWDENTLYDYLLAPKKYIPGEVLAGCWVCSRLCLPQLELGRLSWSLLWFLQACMIFPGLPHQQARAALPRIWKQACTPVGSYCTVQCCPPDM